MSSSIPVNEIVPEWESFRLASCYKLFCHIHGTQYSQEELLLMIQELATARILNSAFLQCTKGEYIMGLKDGEIMFQEVPEKYLDHLKREFGQTFLFLNQDKDDEEDNE